MATCFSASAQYPTSTPVADTVQLFSPGIISDGSSNRDFTISPDGKDIFYTIQLPKFLSSTILHIQLQNGKWSKPEVAIFSGKFKDLEAAFSPDGNTIYFSSDRPVDDKDSIADFDIWKVTRTANGSWSEPQHLGFTVNSAKNEFYPSVTKNGNLYFTVVAAYGKGGEDIVMCSSKKGVFESPVSLPEAVNSTKDEFNAFVDPDENFILFTSFGRSGGFGGGDLYLSKKDKEGNWTPAKILPTPINTTALDYCPFVSWDKQCLIFTSNRVNPALRNKQRKNWEQLSSLIQSPGNSFDDLYWVKFNINW